MYCPALLRDCKDLQCSSEKVRGKAQQWRVEGLAGGHGRLYSKETNFHLLSVVLAISLSKCVLQSLSREAYSSCYRGYKISVSMKM